MKMDRKLIPASMWTPAEAVVDASLRGLESGTLFVVPGWRYKLLVASMKVVPRSLVRAVTLRMARRLKRTG
jgi:short-subunit dehydrogenase